MFCYQAEGEQREIQSSTTATVHSLSAANHELTAELERTRKELAAVHGFLAPLTLYVFLLS